MIYLVTTNGLLASEKYKIISVEQSLELLEKCETLQFDSETFGLDPHIVDILCIQFGSKEHDFQMVVDCQTVNIQKYKKIIETKFLVGHNLCFDIKFMYKHNIIPKEIWDTMIVEQLLHLGYDPKFFRYGLKEVLERRLKVSMDKTIRSQINLRGLDEAVILYSAGDVTYLEDIKEQQEKECQDKDCLKGAVLENNFVKVNAYLEWCGIKLDITKWSNKMKEDQKQLNKYKKDLDDWLLSICYSNDIEGNSLSFVHTTKLIYSSEEEQSDIDSQRHKLLRNGYVCLNKSEKVEPYVVPKVTITTETYQKVYPNSLKYIKEQYTYIETQGDLFTGFDPNPKCSVNWSSSKQVVEIAKAIGFNTSVPDKETGDNKDSVLEKHLRTQKNIDDIFLDLYFSYQEFSKVVSTYGANQLNAVNPLTGRIHTTYRQLGCSSGRMSCGSNVGNPDLAKIKNLPTAACKYPNIQNLPSDDKTRSCFVPESDNIMCSCDFSALESRLGADIYNEQSMIDEFLYGSGDMHSLCAYMVYTDEIPRDTKIQDIKKLYPHLRKSVKAIEFSQQFGGTEYAIASSAGCSLEEAKVFKKAYEEGFPGIAKFKEKGIKAVQQLGYVLMCEETGHKIYWEDHAKWKERQKSFTKEFWDKYKELKQLNPKNPKVAEVREHFQAAGKWGRLALNSPTQGSGSIILKDSAIDLFNWVVDNGYFNTIKLCALVHDEQVWEYPKNIPEFGKFIAEVMEKSAAKYCKAVPIPAEAAIGDHWIH